MASGCCTKLGSDEPWAGCSHLSSWGLRRLLLRCRNHLKYDALSCGCYTYAYETNDCISMMQLIYFNWKALRTVRAQVADRPPYYSTDPPETTTSLEQLLILPADCPAPLGGPSGPPWRTVRSSRIQSTRDENVSGQNPRLYRGLSAPKWRTVHSSILRTPPETSSLDKFQISTADRPLPYSGPSAVHFC